MRYAVALCSGFDGENRVVVVEAATPVGAMVEASRVLMASDDGDAWIGHLASLESVAGVKDACWDSDMYISDPVPVE